MDVTPKSKQLGSLKRRSVGLVSSSRTKLLKSDGTSSESSNKSGDNDSPRNETYPSTSEQPCTPVRQVSLQNEISPQYPHMFRIFHDESPEFRVGWDDGISETVKRKGTPHFDVSIQNRSGSQHIKRPPRRFPTPPRLKQQPKTTDVKECMQWAQSLIEKARKCSRQTPSSSETSTTNSTLETEQNKSNCVDSKGSSITKDILPTVRRSLPVQNCSVKENLELNRKSMPTELNFSTFFDDSASDDILMQCTQAVEERFQKEKVQNVSVPPKTVNNNILSLNKGASSNNLQNKEVRKENSSSRQFHSGSKPALVGPNKVLTKMAPPQPVTVSCSKVLSAATKPVGSVAVTTVASSSASFKQSDITSRVFVKIPDSKSPSMRVTAPSSSKAPDICQLLDEDDDFLSALDLQSLSQMNPPKSANVPIRSTNVVKNASSSVVNNANTNVNSRHPSLNAAQSIRSGPTPINSCTVNPGTSSTNTSNRIVNSLNPAVVNAAKICSQEVIRKKREEAQRRLRSKMFRHSSL